MPGPADCDGSPVRLGASPSETEVDIWIIEVTSFAVADGVGAVCARIVVVKLGAAGRAIGSISARQVTRPRYVWVMQDVVVPGTTS